MSSQATITTNPEHLRKYTSRHTSGIAVPQNRDFAGCTISA